jgi:hypothetical protein
MAKSATGSFAVCLEDDIVGCPRTSVDVEDFEKDACRFSRTHAQKLSVRQQQVHPCDQLRRPVVWNAQTSPKHPISRTLEQNGTATLR